MASVNENDVSTGSYKQSPPHKNVPEKKISKDDNNIDGQEKQRLTGGGALQK